MLCFPFILKWTRCYHGSNSKIWSKYSVIKLQQRMDSEVPASTQISQLSWIVGNLSAYAETHWQIFSTYDTCRHKFRHKFKRQLERTLVLCISLFKPITSFKDGCLYNLIKVRWWFQVRETGQKVLSAWAEWLPRVGVVSGFNAKVPWTPRISLTPIPDFQDHFSAAILSLFPRPLLFTNLLSAQTFLSRTWSAQLPQFLCRSTCAQPPFWQFCVTSLEDLGHVIFV